MASVADAEQSLNPTSELASTCPPVVGRQASSSRSAMLGMTIDSTSSDVVHDDDDG